MDSELTGKENLRQMNSTSSAKINGIKRQLTAAYTPQQNGVAERRNQIIMNIVQCLLSEKEMLKKCWPEAARWTAHVLNRSYTKAIKDMVPEEKWCGIKPNVEYFRVFCSIAHVHIPEQKRTKLDDRSLKCVLLRVSDESKAYRLYDPATKKIIVSRDVIFEEGAKWDWNSSTKNVEQDVLAWEDDDNIAVEESEGGETDGEGDSNEEANDRLEEIQEMDESSPELPQQTRQRREPVWMRDYEAGEHLFEEEEVEEGFAFHISNDDPVNFEEVVKEKK